MYIEVITDAPYKIVVAHIDYAQIQTGYLLKEEATALGKDFFIAASELMSEEDFKGLIKLYYSSNELFGEDDDTT